MHRMLQPGSAVLIAVLLAPSLAFAQASPFLTGANSMVTNFVAWATPVAILVVMGIAAFWMAGRITAGSAIGAIVGIAVLFGAPQIVTWVRGMFGV